MITTNPNGHGDAREPERPEELDRTTEHYEAHPDECCCDTFLGRECCMAPRHGNRYRAYCIEHGEHFSLELRARSRQEAMELGREAAMQWGGECVRVRRLRDVGAT